MRARRLAEDARTSEAAVARARRAEARGRKKVNADGRLPPNATRAATPHCDGSPDARCDQRREETLVVPVRYPRIASRAPRDARVVDVAAFPGRDPAAESRFRREQNG
jgi:hypothetical protein